MSCVGGYSDSDISGETKGVWWGCQTPLCLPHSYTLISGEHSLRLSHIKCNNIIQTGRGKRH